MMCNNKLLAEFYLFLANRRSTNNKLKAVVFAAMETLMKEDEFKEYFKKLKDSKKNKILEDIAKNVKKNS